MNVVLSRYNGEDFSVDFTLSHSYRIRASVWSCHNSRTNAAVPFKDNSPNHHRHHIVFYLQLMVGLEGLEPSIPSGRQILSLLRIPIPPQPHYSHLLDVVNSISKHRNNFLLNNLMNPRIYPQSIAKKRVSDIVSHISLFFIARVFKEWD